MTHRLAYRITQRFTLTAGLALWAMVANAQAVTPESLVAAFQADGFTTIEVQHGRSQSKIEAIKGDLKNEVVIDRASGTIVKSETEFLSGDYRFSPGLSVRSRPNRDFVQTSDVVSSSNDDSSKGRGRGRGRGRGMSSDDSDDDSGGRGRGRGRGRGGDDDGDSSGRGRGGDDSGGRGGNSGSGSGGDDD